MKFTFVITHFVIIAIKVADTSLFAVANESTERTESNTSGVYNARKLLRVSGTNDSLVIVGQNHQQNVRRRVRGRNSNVSKENQSNNDPIACVWQAYFETIDHAEACLSLQNSYSVPYTCDDGFYTNICCTVSSCTDPTMNTFGACHKVVTTESGGNVGSGNSNEKPVDTSTSEQLTDLDESNNAKDDSVEWLVDDASPVGEEEVAQETADNEENAPETIRCVWKSFFDTMSRSDACLATGDEFTVPYTCEDGRFVCCTVSSCVNPTMNTFGTCLKDNSTEQSVSDPTKMATTDEWTDDLAAMPVGEDEAAPDTSWINVNGNTHPTTLVRDTSTSTAPTENDFTDKIMSTTPSKINFSGVMTAPTGSIKDADVQDDIQCAWLPWFGTMSHSDACMATGDDYIVPYTCEDGREICCTVSDCINPTLNIFGTCLKDTSDGDLVTTIEPTSLDIASEVGSSPVDVPVGDEEAAADFTEITFNDGIAATGPTETEIDIDKGITSTQPTENDFNDISTSPVDSIEDTDLLNDIKCAWFPWFDTMSHSSACMSTGDEHTVPYTCDDGREICCTVSDCFNPTMGAFGTCLKVIQG